jgi:hypothetical protein
VLDEPRHAAVVDGWLRRAARGLPAAALVRLFAAALDALWVRTRVTLGEVTLTAIAERVVHNAAEKFPVFAGLRVDPIAGIDCRQISGQLSKEQGSELLKGIRFVLLEFLTVLGHLTAEILTHELHAELVGVPRTAALAHKKTARKPNPPSKDSRS